MTPYNPHRFPVHGGCQPLPRSSRLHDLWQRALDGVCVLYAAVMVWCWLVVVLGVL